MILRSPATRRLLTNAIMTAVTLVAVSAIIYGATLLVPADPAKIYFGRAATPQQIREFRHDQGLDVNPALGYVRWASQAARGQWGHSIFNNTPVTDIVGPRLRRSVFLALLAFALAVPVAFVVGLVGGRRAGSRLDLILSLGVLCVAALPDFIIGVTLLWLFAVYIPVLPVSSAGILFSSFWNSASSYALPAITLALTVVPHIARQVRSAIREAAEAPHVRAATLRGLPARLVTWRYLVPTATGRVINVIALNLPELLAGVVVVESVFAFPGIGRALIEAITENDVAVVQAVALVIAAVYVIANFVADSLVVLSNPRLRAGRGA